MRLPSFELAIAACSLRFRMGADRHTANDMPRPIITEREVKQWFSRKTLHQTKRKHCGEVARGGLLQKVIPARARDRLIDLGYIEEKLRGLVATARGKLYFGCRRRRR